MQQYDLLILFLLFLVGVFGHTFGFVFNDIIDYKLDKTSKELADRPLISGTISIKKAWLFAIVSIITAFTITFIIAYTKQSYFPIILLAISSFFITIYDLVSKKLPAMDIFVALGIFFLILYGASTSVNSINISKLAWFVCILGAIQVLFMQFIAGGMKDIENDYKRGAKTLAVTMGVRVTKGSKLQVSNRFKALAYGIQIFDVMFVFLPFFIVWGIKNLTLLQYLQWIIIVLIAIIMFFLSYKLLTMEYFIRNKARKYIGSHYMINFAIVPIMLMSLNPWAGLLMFLPGLGFILSNVVLHGTLLQPKTM
jgi:4-hydroxybenzoate polyprenyltransferase